jgi:hypothetical protein
MKGIPWSCATTFERSVRATRLGGTISLIGVLAGLEGSNQSSPLNAENTFARDFSWPAQVLRSHERSHGITQSAGDRSSLSIPRGTRGHALRGNCCPFRKDSNSHWYSERERKIITKQTPSPACEDTSSLYAAGRRCNLQFFDNRSQSQTLNCISCDSPLRGPRFRKDLDHYQ